MSRLECTIVDQINRTNPDFTDPEVEASFIRQYVAVHDAMLEGLRTVDDECSLAHCRATLAQHGVDESHLPWELSVSYNLRLSEALEKLALTRKR